MRFNFISLALIFISILVGGMGFFGIACINGMSNMCPSLFVVSFFDVAVSFVVLFIVFAGKDTGGVFESFDGVWRKILQKAVPVRDPKFVYWLSIRSVGEPGNYFGRCYTVN